MKYVKNKKHPPPPPEKNKHTNKQNRKQANIKQNKLNTLMPLCMFINLWLRKSSF